MTDFLGNELHPGDAVVYIYSTRSGGHRMESGVIDSIERGYAKIRDAKYGIYEDKPSEATLIEYGLSGGRVRDNRVRVKSTSIFLMPKPPVACG